MTPAVSALERALDRSYEWEERAAIVEFDGKLPRDEAEREAGPAPAHMVEPVVSSTEAWRCYLGCADDETIELTCFDRRGKPVVAYARTVEEHLRLMRQADASDCSGCYTLFNRIHPGLYARIGAGRWIPFASRASDNEVSTIRCAYLDFDAVRPRNISSTSDEKRAALDVCLAATDFLVSELGGDRALGFGDSGNGYAVFIRLVPVEPSKGTTAAIARLLRYCGARFDTPGVKVDASVCNPARLCPAFGTLKRKGVDCAERPHRRTFFVCHQEPMPVPLEDL